MIGNESPIEPTITAVSWQENREDLAMIRQQVFMNEQGVSADDEWDDDDASAVHFLARVNNQPVACARFLPNGKIGRMAVLKDFRSRGIGHALLTNIIEHAANHGHQEVFLDAQVQVLSFYATAGFIAEGTEFQDAGITHQRTRMKLSPTETTQTSVVRLDGPHQCLTALLDQVQTARQSLDILTDQLTPTLYANLDLVERISALARRSRQSRVRVLVRDTRPLKDGTHNLVQLAQRLPSHIDVRGLREMPRDPVMGFCAADRKSLVYFNNEADFIGFRNHSARAEIKRLLEEFNHLWDHYSFTDPNLKMLVL